MVDCADTEHRSAPFRLMLRAAVRRHGRSSVRRSQRGRPSDVQMAALVAPFSHTWVAMTAIEILGDRVRELAAATASAMGPMVPPGIDLTSPAHQDLKRDATLGDPATLAHPVYDVLAHLELLSHAANDHMDAFGRLLAGDAPSWFGHIALARAVVETSSRTWLIAAPGVDALDRVRLHLLERQYEIAHQTQLYAGPFKALPAEIYDVGKKDLDTRRTSMITWAMKAGLSVTSGQIAGPRLGPSELIIRVFESDKPAADTGQATMLGAYHYNRLSAVAHGLPSGVSIYLQPATAPDGHAHNVLRPSDVGHVALAALTAYDAGFDRVALYLRWPHAELQPMRWWVISQIRKLIDE